MKRKLFIGSSSEGKQVAEKLKTKILEDCSNWIEPIIWADKGVFTLNQSTFHSLIDSSRKFEYGIFVATADDLVAKRDEVLIAPRDNVLFEAGMFLGSLGLTRAFLLVDSECKLPSDYAGVTVAMYNESSLDEKITEVVDSIKTTRNSYKLNIIPSTALAVGYFENFIKPFAEKQKNSFKFTVLIPQHIADIYNLIDIHRRDTKSKKHRRFCVKQRPIVFQDPSKRFWDIPTTLLTLDIIINTIISHTEIGTNPDKEEWIGHEIRNFIGTLEHLISQNSKCNGSVFVEYLQKNDGNN